MKIRVSCEDKYEAQKLASLLYLKDTENVEAFADFLQSVIEKEHRITDTATFDSDVEIKKS